MMGRKLLLLAASLLVALLAGELLLRAVGYYGVRGARIERIRPVDDPVLDYRRIPGTSWIYNNLRYDINRSGWRDRDYQLERPPGVFRIVVLGDSVTNGHGVEMEEIYAKVLERRLEESRPGGLRYEVPILTLGALNSEQEVHLLEVEGLRYDPDLVVLAYVLNDPEEGASLRRDREARRHRSALRRLKELGQHSSLVHLVYRSGQRLLWRLGLALGREEVAPYVSNDYFTALHRDPTAWARVERSFDHLRELTEERQIGVVVAIFPVLHRLSDYPWAELHRQVRLAAEARGFEVLDLLGALGRHRASELQIASGDHIHPNPLGHRLAGEALYDLLLQRRLVPEAASR